MIAKVFLKKMSVPVSFNGHALFSLIRSSLRMPHCI